MANERNIDNVRDISSFLMMNKSSPTKGYSAAEIAASVPTLKESTVYRILKQNPQFVQTQNSIHPKRYYFDPGKVVVAKRPIEDWQIRPEFKVEPKAVNEWLGHLIRLTKPEDSEPYRSSLYDQVVNLGMASNNAVKFSKNEEPLQPVLWERAQFSLDQLENFAANLYQRVQQLKNDPRYNTTEWWAILTEGL